MKKFLALIMAAAMSLSLVACGGSSAAPAAPADGAPAASDAAPAPADDGKVYELSLSTHDPETSQKTVYLQQWADAVEEASNGRIKITVFSGGSLAAGTAALDTLRTGACDIAWIYTSYFSGQFPLAEVICNPIGISSVPQAVDVLYNLYDEFPALQDELSEFVPLMMHSNPTNKICTVDGYPVDSIDDLKGLTFRASAGTASDLLTAWGATPIQMAPGDIYQAVQKATVQGYVFDWSGVKAFGLQEVTKNFTTMPVYLGAYFLMMNMDSFNALPADLQQVIIDCSGIDASKGMAWVFEGDERQGRQTIEDAGCTMIDVSAENEAAFKEASQVLLDNWASTITVDGLDSKAYLDRATELAAQYYISAEDVNKTLDEMGK